MLFGYLGTSCDWASIPAVYFRSISVAYSTLKKRTKKQVRASQGSPATTEVF